MARTLRGKVTIPVGWKADVLYFLHTANITRPIAERERARMTDRKRPFQLPEVAKYVLQYADGKTREVPVLLERYVGHWLQEGPKPLSGARAVPALLAVTTGEIVATKR
jgi:hypothetical protein